MSAPHLSTLVLAAGSNIWSFPTWKQRTGNVVPPLHNTASPAITVLESWELTVIRKLSEQVDALTSFRGRVRYIRKSTNSDTKLRAATKAWHTWAQPRLSSWNIQADIEDLFRSFGRHPSQISSFLSNANANLDNLLLILVPSVADLLFGDDAYLNPSAPKPLVKFDLYDFVLALLPVVWLEAKRDVTADTDILN